jgi:hypothetical protein
VGPAIAGALLGLRFIAGLPEPGAGPAILATYTAAQGLRAVGLVRQRGAAASPG